MSRKLAFILPCFLLAAPLAYQPVSAQFQQLWIKLGSVKPLAAVHDGKTAKKSSKLPFPKKLRKRQKGEELLVQVPLETYVAQVLAAEIPTRFHLEALKAQAVAIRTLASAKPTPHQREGYDFCDSTHCQVFSGHSALPSAVRSAVAQTRGLILTHGGKPITPLYHSTCGGHTSSNGAVFGGEPLPYLSGASDELHCEASPHHQWRGEVTRKQLAATFPEIHSLESIEILNRDDGGRVLDLALVGKNKIQIRAQDFLLRIGRRLGWSTLKSASFSMEASEGIFQFQGQGLGHGVGLCQWGSQGMAKLGKNFREILRHYYPGTQLVRSR